MVHQCDCYGDQTTRERQNLCFVLELLCFGCCIVPDSTLLNRGVFFVGDIDSLFYIASYVTTIEGKDNMQISNAICFFHTEECKIDYAVVVKKAFEKLLNSITQSPHR